MDKVVGKHFKKETIVIDSKTAYIGCTFKDCHLIYMGGDFSLLEYKVENCQITITGEAGKVLQFMQAVGMITPQMPPQPPPAVAQLPDTGALH